MTVFVDTNVLVYATDGAAGPKQDVAIASLAAAAPFRLSAQVLSEFIQVTTRKLDPPLPLAEAIAQAADLAPLAVPIDGELVLGAAVLADLHRLSLWDAQIVAAAKRAGCDTVLTEDLTHGQVIEGVRIVDPFR